MTIPLIATIPMLATGNYKLKIVTQYSRNKDLADTKTTVYGKPCRCSKLLPCKKKYCTGVRTLTPVLFPAHLIKRIWRV
jgi:hypothetical protein